MTPNSTGLRLTLAATAALVLAGCGQPAETPPAKPAEAPVAAAPAPVAAPALDKAALQGLLTPDEALEVVSLDAAGAASVSGEVKGYKAPVYAVPVAMGQTLSVAFEPSNSNLYVNVVDAADTSGAAVHRGEVDGASASITTSKTGVYLIKPFQPRATARRGEAGTFKLTLAVQ